jgi:hypothetical protein
VTASTTVITASDLYRAARVLSGTYDRDEQLSDLAIEEALAADRLTELLMAVVVLSEHLVTNCHPPVGPLWAFRIADKLCAQHGLDDDGVSEEQ